MTDHTSTGNFKPSNSNVFKRPELNHKFQFKNGVQITQQYKVIEPLGYGGFAEVYHCRDTKLMTDVAVKILNETQNQEGLQEARASAPLRHPNIVRVMDVSEPDSEFSYIVFDYVKGQTLQKKLKETDKQRLPLSPETITIFKQIAGALDYAHAFNEGVIHRDVKSSNIILKENGPAFLTDFGLAEVKQEPGEVLSAVTKDLQPSTLRGTLIYMAPEQLRTGKPGDKFSDQYSFGVTVYEALTGQYPFKGTNPNNLFFSIVADEPLPPRIANSELPIGVEEVLLKVLSKEPEMRFTSCIDFIDALTIAADAYLEASDLYEEAIELFKNEDWSNALLLFEKLEDQAPGFKESPYYLVQTQQKIELLNLLKKANYYIQQGRYEEALETLTSIGKRDPEFKVTEVKTLRDTAIKGQTFAEQKSLEELYIQAINQFKQKEYQACLNTLDVISGKSTDYPDNEGLQEKAQEALDRERHLHELYNQATTLMQSETWDKAHSTLKELNKEESGYKDVEALIVTSRVMHRLSSFLKKAKSHFDEKDYLNCLATIDELKHSDEEYKSEQVAQLRQEALTGLYHLSENLLAKNKFEESLNVLESLRQQQADYPNIKNLQDQIIEGKRIYELKLHLNSLYEQAKDKLNDNEYWDALALWSQIESEEEIAFKDVVEVAGRAKFALSTDAKAALAASQPEKALDIVNRLQSFDPDYAELSTIRKQAEALIAQQKIAEDNRRKLIMWGSGIAGLIILGIILFIVFQPGVTPPIIPTITPTTTNMDGSVTETAKAIVALSQTSDPTSTPKATATHTATSSPTATNTSEPTLTPTPETPTPEVESLATAVLASTIYKEPDENSDELTFVAIGETVTVLGESDTGSWLLIENKDGIAGWVAANRFEPDGPTPTPRGNTTTALESSSLFCSPNSNSDELTFVTEGDAVEVLGRSANESWLFVRDKEGNEGFSAANRFDWPEENIPQLSIAQPDTACSGSPPEEPTTSGPVTITAIYPVDDGNCHNGGWARNIYAEAAGGDGSYRYYWEGNLVGGPTSSSITFDVNGAGGPVIGKIRVESGGQVYEADFFVPSPSCN